MSRVLATSRLRLMLPIERVAPGLGGFELVLGGRDITKSIRRRNAVRLAKFLALAPNRRAHRATHRRTVA